MDKVTKQAIAILESAAFVQMIPGAHCKGAFAKDEAGAEVTIYSISACRWCAVGSLLAADDPYCEAYEIARNALKGVTYDNDIRHNDNRQVKGVDVAKKMWLAAEVLRNGLGRR